MLFPPPWWVSRGLLRIQAVTECRHQLRGLSAAIDILRCADIATAADTLRPILAKVLPAAADLQSSAVPGSQAIAAHNDFSAPPVHAAILADRTMGP